MTTKPTENPLVRDTFPRLGDIVIYTNAHDIEMPGIVTGHVLSEPAGVHLKLFPPPGEAEDLIDPQWGAEEGTGPRTWRRQ